MLIVPQLPISFKGINMIAYLRRIFSTIGFVIVTGLVLSGASLYLFAKVAEDVVEQETIVQVDLALANELHSMVIANSTTVQVFKFVSLFGFQLLFALAIIVAVIFLLRKQWFYLLIWGVTLLGGNLLNVLIKTLFARPRPVFVDPVALANSFSFPSGHSMQSLIAYGMGAYLICLIVKNHYARIFIVFAAVMAIVLIGISRLYLGVHYLSDVIGGFTAGAVWLATCITAIRVYRYRAAHLAKLVNTSDLIGSTP